MTEDKAKKRLASLLHSFTAGRLLHLLAQLFAEAAKEARQDKKELLYQRLVLVEAGLIVAGYGVDAACPE